MNNINPRIRILTLLYEQCNRLGIIFPYDYQFLLKKPKHIDFRACNQLLLLNASLAARQKKKEVIKESNLSMHRKATPFDIRETKAYKSAIKVKKGPKNSKNKRRKNKKWSNRDPWSPIVYVGHMWRS